MGIVFRKVLVYKRPQRTSGWGKVAAGTVPGVKRAAIRKLDQELGISVRRSHRSGYRTVAHVSLKLHLREARRSLYASVQG